MLTIHGRATSVNVQLVMWAVNELQLRHERLDVGGVFGGTDTPAFRAMNPNRLVPVLEDGALSLFESAAILRYLAAAYGDERFWPGSPRLRGALDQWAEWGKVTLSPAIGAVFYQLVRTPPSRRDPAAVARSAERIRPLAQILDARLGEGPWLAGEDFTFADIPCGHMLYRYYTLPIERAETPHLDAWYARLQSRPAFRDHAMVSYESLYARD
jgi:glutathione S-transferase